MVIVTLMFAVRGGREEAEVPVGNGGGLEEELGL